MPLRRTHSLEDAYLRYGDSIQLACAAAGGDGSKPGVLSVNVGSSACELAPGRYKLSASASETTPQARNVFTLQQPPTGDHRPAGGDGVLRYGDRVVLAAQPCLLALIDNNKAAGEGLSAPTTPLLLLRSTRCNNLTGAGRRVRSLNNGSATTATTTGPSSSSSSSSSAAVAAVQAQEAYVSRSSSTAEAAAPSFSSSSSAPGSGGDADAVWQLRHPSGDALVTDGTPLQRGQEVVLLHAMTGQALALCVTSPPFPSLFGPEPEVEVVTHKPAARRASVTDPDAGLRVGLGGGNNSDVGSVGQQAHPANRWRFLPQ